MDQFFYNRSERLLTKPKVIQDSQILPPKAIQLLPPKATELTTEDHSKIICKIYKTYNNKIYLKQIFDNYNDYDTIVNSLNYANDQRTISMGKLKWTFNFTKKQSHHAIIAAANKDISDINKALSVVDDIYENYTAYFKKLYPDDNCLTIQDFYSILKNTCNIKTDEELAQFTHITQYNGNSTENPTPNSGGKRNKKISKKRNKKTSKKRNKKTSKKRNKNK